MNSTRSAQESRPDKSLFPVDARTIRNEPGDFDVPDLLSADLPGPWLAAHPSSMPGARRYAMDGVYGRMTSWAGCAGCSTCSIGGGRPWGQGLVQAAEPGDEAAQAYHGEGPQDVAAVGDDQPQPAAVGLGPLVRSDQHVEPR